MAYEPLTRKHACDACGRYDVPYAPMLRDDLWQIISTDLKALICFDCAEKSLGRKIQLNDLNDSPLSRMILRLFANAR